LSSVLSVTHEAKTLPNFLGNLHAPCRLLVKKLIQLNNMRNDLYILA
jgi:hypothetical protein